MTTQAISVTIIAIFLLILLAGFLFGLARGFTRSIVRLLLVLVSLVIAFFVTQTVTNAIVGIDITNFGLVLEGKTMTSVTDILQTLISKYISDIPAEAYSTILDVVPKMLLNIVVFILLFYIIRLVTMIIYWIIWGCCFNKKKTKGKNKHRLLGSLVGVVQNFIIFLVLLVPVTGAINIVTDVKNNVYQEISNSQDSSASASETTSMLTVSEENALLVSDGESAEAPAEDNSNESESSTESTSKIETTVKSISEIVDIYRNTWVGKFLNSIKVEKLCGAVFDNLTTVTQDDEKYNLHDEVVAVSGAYKYYADIKDNGGFDLTNEDCLNNIEGIIDSCYNSKLASKFIDNVIVEVATKWKNGETFMSISRPSLGNGTDDAVTALLQSLIDSKDKHATLVSATKMVSSLVNVSSNLMTDGELNIEELGNLLETLTADETTKELAKTVIADNIGNIVKETEIGDDYSSMITEAINGLFDADYTDGTNNISNEIKVITSAMDIAQTLKADTVDNDALQESAETVVKALVDSTVMYDIITDDNSDIKAQLQNFVDGNENTQKVISDVITSVKNDYQASETLTQDEKDALLTKLDNIAEIFIKQSGAEEQ